MNSERKYYIRVALIAYAIWAVFYEVVGRYAATLPTLDWATRFDHMIPLMPKFVWAYAFCYIFPFAPLFAIRDWHKFNRALLAITFANVPAFIIFIVFPVALPRADMGSSWSEQLLGLIYYLDFHPAVTSFPSLHVIFSWLVYMMCRGGNLGKVGDRIAFFIALSITISTLFVKQHIILDVVVGVVWAFAAWALAGWVYGKITTVDMTPKVALKQVVRKIIPAAVLSGAALLALLRI